MTPTRPEVYANAYARAYQGLKMPYRITYTLDLFNDPRDRQLSLRTLQYMLDTLYTIDLMYLKAHPDTPLLYNTKVRYVEEPYGQEDWQDIPTTMRLGIGDCEDLACWRAAELTTRFGIPSVPIFHEQKRPEGGYLYHILVKRPDRALPEDPSRILGMR